MSDPALFERVKAHIKGGRWSVVNGWWVQPDVNIPTEEALLATARIGLDWFKQHLGVESVPVAQSDGRGGPHLSPDQLRLLLAGRRGHGWRRRRRAGSPSGRMALIT
jgi:alpha-mannosidase